MDLVMAFEGLKNATQIVKAIKDADVALEKAELKGKLAEVMSNLAEAQLAIQEHRLDRQNLEDEVARLKDAFEAKGKLERRRDALVLLDDVGKWHAGPFCISCWESDQRLRSLTRVGGQRTLLCPTCKHVVTGSMDLWGEPDS